MPIARCFVTRLGKPDRPRARGMFGCRCASSSQNHPEAKRRAGTDDVGGSDTPVFVAAGIGAILLVVSDLTVELRTLAALDPLTGILNWRGLEEAASRAAANGRRYRQPISVAVFGATNSGSASIQNGFSAAEACNWPNAT